MAVHEYENNIERYNELTRQETCGDVLLAKVMKNAGVELTGAQPIMQREPPFSFIFTETTSCYPVVTYHHMPPDWIEVVWEYEQLWLAEHGAVRDFPLLRIFSTLHLPAHPPQQLKW